MSQNDEHPRERELRELCEKYGFIFKPADKDAPTTIIVGAKPPKKPRDE
jgi:hypothetical protein